MTAKQFGQAAKALALSLIALSIGAPGPAAALLLPAPNFPLALSVDQVGLRSRYTVFANSFGDFDGGADALTTFPSNWQESISHAQFVASVGRRDSAVSIAEIQGRTQVGRLSAKTHAMVEIGPGSAGASMELQFMDVLQVDTEGVLHLNWKVVGTVDEQILRRPSDQAGSSLTAELFVWPYGPLPTVGLPYNFTTYARTIITPAGIVSLAPNTGRYSAGSRWWVMGQLSIQSDADASNLLRQLPPYRVATTADFGHTVELFISPDPSTPDASFHSASGYDYRPAAIPEPASGLLLLVGLLTLRLVTVRRI